MTKKRNRSLAVKVSCTYPECHRAYSRLEKLKKHIKQHHLKISKTYKCPHCDKVSYEKFNIILHIRTHTGEKPFICRFCSKSFASQSNKNDHERRHQKLRPYKCLYCDKEFYRKYLKGQHEESCEQNHRIADTPNVFEVTLVKKEEDQERQDQQILGNQQRKQLGIVYQQTCEGNHDGASLHSRSNLCQLNERTHQFKSQDSDLLSETNISNTEKVDGKFKTQDDPRDNYLNLEYYQTQSSSSQQHKKHSNNIESDNLKINSGSQTNFTMNQTINTTILNTFPVVQRLKTTWIPQYHFQHAIQIQYSIGGSSRLFAEPINNKQEDILVQLQNDGAVPSLQCGMPQSFTDSLNYEKVKLGQRIELGPTLVQANCEMATIGTSNHGIKQMGLSSFDNQQQLRMSVNSQRMQQTTLKDLLFEQLIRKVNMINDNE